MAELSFARYRRDSKFSHYLFRFPAKFHPPVARCLIEKYSQPGDVVLDPFCGSGTLLVEALLSGRNAVGVDIDPVATFISRVKSTPVDPDVIESVFRDLQKRLVTFRRSATDYDRLMHEDLSPISIARFAKAYAIPSIPHIDHWFRSYVVIDLARIRQAILRLRQHRSVRDFFLACFASIIRNSSNADPVPVSGLEVTAHMRRIDAAGRRIDPFELFEAKVRKELQGMRDLWASRTESSVLVRNGDASSLSRVFQKSAADVVITSPPYNTAVDYYRRHQLEMYWLGFVAGQEERVELATRYLGRVQIRKSNYRLRKIFASSYIKNLITHARQIDAARERTVAHYCASMSAVFGQLARALKPNGRAVFVVGNSKWNGQRVRATKLLAELASEHFTVIESLSYTTRNRYMSYKRHNGANVNREYVLVLKKTVTPKRRKAVST